MKTTAVGIEFDSASFVGAKQGRYGTRYAVRTYDDGFGPLWVYRESLGVLGIVRAQSWEDAWSCVEDEILDDADPDYLADPGYDVSEGELPEGCTFRPNGAGSNPWNQTGIAQQDLNGNALDLLTPEMLEKWGIVITWRPSR